MSKNELTFLTSPTVTLATNKFINVPVILKYEDTPLIEIVQEVDLQFTSQIPIYHSDGTYLAKVKGNRIYATEHGKKAGLAIDIHEDVTACTLDGKTIFELKHQIGDSFKLDAELYTPDAYFLKTTDSPLPELYKSDGSSITIEGLSMSGNTISNSPVGIWVTKNSFSIG